MTTTVSIGGNQYEVDDNGDCFVIKTKRSRYGITDVGYTYRSRITSPRKIAQLRKMAAAEIERRDPSHKPLHEETYEDRLDDLGESPDY